MEFLTVARPALAKIVVTRSIFVARVREVVSETETRAFLAETRQAEPAASHHAYAYRLGDGPQGVAHCNDAGEPGGTAGRPIQNAIQAAGLTNVMLIVSRYFGGKKLGIPGLTDAYREAAEAALAAAGTVLRGERRRMELSVPYEQLDLLRHLLRQYGVEEIEAEYGVSVSLRLWLPWPIPPALLESLGAHGLSPRPTPQA